MGVDFDGTDAIVFVPKALRTILPYECSEEIKVLGLIWAQKLNFITDIRTVLQKANVRHSATARLAGSEWAVEGGAMRSANLALLVSLRTFGVTTVGSGPHARELGNLDTRLVNVAARNHDTGCR